MKYQTIITTTCLALALAGTAHAAVIASNTTSDLTNTGVYSGTTNTVSDDGSNVAWSQNIMMAQSFTTGTLGSVNVLSTITVDTVGATSASTVTAIPGPSAAVLGGLAGLGLVLRRKRA